MRQLNERIDQSDISLKVRNANVCLFVKCIDIYC